jgi:hypothetical protein
MELDLPKSLVEVGDQAFWSCSSLQRVNFSPFIAKIGASAFGQCSALNKVVIPAKDVVMGKDVFEFCPELKSYKKGEETIKLIFTLEDI